MLRLRTGQQDDPTTDLDWFVTMCEVHGRNPWMVLLHEGQKLVAVLLLAERRILGMPSGYLKGEGMDEGLVICEPRLRATYLPLLLKGLFSRRSVLIAHISELAQCETAWGEASELQGPHHVRLDYERKDGLYHYRLKLKDTLEKTLASYGAHTRRNIRYYLRKARSENCRFVSALTEAERMEAVMDLRADATHKVTVESAELREHAMRLTPSPFAMGVQGADGRWLSYLTGWRRGKQTFISWQMNRVTGKGSSMGTAIRAFLMEEEIARGATEILFLGGSSAVFKRCCVVEPSVHLIVRRRGLRGWALSRLLGRAVTAGHPLSFSS